MYFSSISIPKNFLLYKSADTAVVPDPKKGSKTKSFSLSSWIGLAF